MQQNQRGDTIIEVMLAIAVVSMVLAASYKIANRALLTGRYAQEQTEALKYAESQLEKLKYKASLVKPLDEAGGTVYDTAASQTSFCLDDDVTMSKITTGSAQYAAKCTAKSGLYDLLITYDPPNNLYKARVSWESPIITNANVVVAYKLFQ